MEKISLFRRLHFKLGATFGALVLMGAILGNAISVQMTEREFTKLIDQQFENTTGMVEGFFSTVGQMAQIWGNHFVSDPELLNAIENNNDFTIIRLLKSLQQGATADVVVWLDKEGKILYDSFEPKHVGHSLMSWGIVRRAVTNNENGSGIVSDLGNFIIYGSTTLIDRGELKGIVLIGYSLNDTLLQQIKRNTEIGITIIRRRAVMASTFNNLERRLSTVPLSYIGYQMLLEEQGHLSRLTIDGISYLAEADKIESMNPSMEGSILLTYPEANLNAIKDRLFTGFSTIAIIGFVLALFISLRFASGILSPLRELLAFSERADSRAGSPDAINERFNTLAKDEVGALANNFNHLIDTLAKRNVELESAVDAEGRANQAKSEFISNMSHELRTPLHAILSFSKLGANKLDPAHMEKLESYFSNIRVSGERLNQLIEELLDVSRLDSGKITLDKRKSDLLNITYHVIEDHQKLIDEHRMSVDFTPAIDSAVAEFDPQRIAQVIGHLLTNAIQYSEDGQTIGISLTESILREGNGSAYLFTIQDNGVGIPPDEIETIFDKFFQGSNTKTGAGGTGLGLAISKGIITEHGGEIWGDNLEGGGVAFYFTLPSETL